MLFDNFKVSTYRIKQGIFQTTGRRNKKGNNSVMLGWLIWHGLYSTIMANKHDSFIWFNLIIWLIAFLLFFFFKSWSLHTVICLGVSQVQVPTCLILWVDCALAWHWITLYVISVINKFAELTLGRITYW